MRRIGSIRHLAVSLGGLAITSGFHFLLNIALIRGLEPTAYGVFSLVTVTTMFGSWIVAALSATPLSVYLPGLRSRARRVVLEAMLASVCTLLSVVIGVGCTALVLFLDGDPGVALCAGCYAMGWISRGYNRNYACARQTPCIALFGDLVYAGCALVILLVGASVLEPASPLAMVMLALGAASVIASLSVLAMLGAPLSPTFRWMIIRRYGAIWSQVRWSLAGVLSTFLQMQAHSLLVGLFVGPSAYAPLAAAQVLFGPVRIAVQAWQMVMRPDLAVAIASGRWREIRRSYRVWMIVISLLAAGGAAVLALFWSPIHTFLFATRYETAPMGMIVALSYATVCVSAVSAVPSCTLQAFAAFRLLAVVTMVGAVVSLVGVMLVLLVWTPAHSLLALLAAEAVSTSIMLVVMRRRIAAARPVASPI